jgi:hypothetical protein
MVSSKFKKGDLVIIDVAGKPTEFEVLSPLTPIKGARVSGEVCYEVRNVITGIKMTASEDEILRLATPVDNSAELFSASASARKRSAKE